jgi:hypothetical protein
VMRSSLIGSQWAIELNCVRFDGQHQYPAVCHAAFDLVATSVITRLHDWLTKQLTHA